MTSAGESEGLGGFSGVWRRVAKVPAADGVGFEPTNPCGLAVFKTAALNRSATHPVSPGSAHYHAHPKNEKRAHPAAAKRVCQRPVYAKRATPSARSIATCASAG
jgi:hypothetical protein